MTQKELLYFEDAVMHEANVIEMIDFSIEQLENNDLISFMKNQRKEHVKMKKNLLEMLEVKANE